MLPVTRLPRGAGAGAAATADQGVDIRHQIPIKLFVAPLFEAATPYESREKSDDIGGGDFHCRLYNTLLGTLVNHYRPGSGACGGGWRVAQTHRNQNAYDV